MLDTMNNHRRVKFSNVEDAFDPEQILTSKRPYRLSQAFTPGQGKWFVCRNTKRTNISIMLIYILLCVMPTIMVKSDAVEVMGMSCYLRIRQPSEHHQFSAEHRIDQVRKCFREKLQYQ